MSPDKLPALRRWSSRPHTGRGVFVRSIAAAMAVLLTTSCAPKDDPNRIAVSMIGPPPKLGDPDREMLDSSRALLVRETAMGLVAFDASGQIEPALAESWIVTDDGRSIVFRIQRLKWPDGREVSGRDVAASLNRAIAANSENRLKPLLGAIDAVVGMTGRVVEIRLKTPRPNLLQLLAQPELSIRRNGTGLGPWRISGRSGNALVLKPSINLMATSQSESAAVDERRMLVKGGRAALAVARFIHGTSDLVLGGTVADWPFVAAAQLDGSARLRRDPVEGLFGLAIISRTAFLRERTVRDALAMAVDRAALAQALAIPRWTLMDQLLPSQLDSGRAPARANWAEASQIERIILADRRIVAWKKTRGVIAPLRIALPKGPGMEMLFARIATDWRRIGVAAVLVSFADETADLRLIDEVAPNSSANWYLTRTGCDYNVSCSVPGDFALSESRAAPSLGQRSAALSRADAAYAEHAGYIALAKPLRWSLVGAKLVRYRDNSMGVHPFAQLRAATSD